MADNEHEVDFHKYCALCKFKETAETEDPCDICLEEPGNSNSKRPINFIEKE